MKCTSLCRFSALAILLTVCELCTSCQRSEPLLLMTYNIRNGRGLDEVSDLGRIARVIEESGADVVALQEIDSATLRSNGRDILQELATLTDMYPTFAAAIPFQGGAYGVGILSANKPLGYRRIPLPGAEEARVMLLADFGAYTVACTHWSLTPTDRIASAGIVRSLVGEVDSPLILVGDLNGEPQAAEIATLESFLQRLNPTEEATYPSDVPTACIDYMFATPGRVKEVECHVYKQAALASDHLPLLARLVIKR